MELPSPRERPAGNLGSTSRYIYLINDMNALHTFFARLHLKSHGRFLGFGTSPAADWKIIFFSTAFLAVLIIISSVFLFIKIDKGEIFAVEKSVGKTKKVLNTVIL